MSGLGSSAVWEKAEETDQSESKLRKQLSDHGSLGIPEALSSSPNTT